MELIPIIYTVLKIVVVLTILTLTISFIGYKLRQRKGENGTINNKNANLFEPIEKAITPLKSDLKSNEARSVSKPREARPVSKSNEARQEKLVGEKNKDDNQRRHAHKDPSKHKVEPHTDKPRIQNERILVLKSLSTPRAKEEMPKKTKTKTGKDQTRALGDDILDKYMEDEDNDMFTLKVKKNKENPEGNV